MTLFRSYAIQDVYKRQAEAIPNLGGISTDDRAKVNNATLRNRGWELSVNWQDQLKCGFRCV